MNEKIKRLAEMIETQTYNRLRDSFLKARPDYAEAPDWLRKDAIVNIKPGKLYTKIDVGTSGKYMVDADGNIFGIKAYGVIHRGHHYGTLETIDNYYWGDYVAVKIRNKLEVVR